MKLEKILSNLNSLEKNSFIKIIDGIIANKPKKHREINKILSDNDLGLKNLDSVVISKIFNLVETEFSDFIKAEFVNTSSQLDILIDIIIRDGNCIMKQDWFSRLYESELKSLGRKYKALDDELNNPKSELSDDRKRDYRIYKSCVHTAFYNDLKNKREAKITDDELSILLTLSHEIELSLEEVKLINYLVLGVKPLEIDTVINELKNIGVIFYSKKNNTVYVADEMVRVLRLIREKEVADKFLRRILRSLKEPQINLVCRKHGIERKPSFEEKIKAIINEGISFTNLLAIDIHKDGTNLSDKKKFLNSLWETNLNISTSLKGTTLEEKINNIILHFETVEKDEKVGISVDGYEKLLVDLSGTLSKLNKQVKSEFELQDEDVLKSNLLLDYNIKPRDILDIIKYDDIDKFCKAMGVKTRGNTIENILDAYKDSENLYLENYVNVGLRDLNTLKENGIIIKEADLGIKFEDLTKSIFSQLGINVDEDLKNQLNTKKDKIDIS